MQVPILKDPKARWESTAVTCLSDKGSPDQGYITIRNEVGRYIRYGADQEEFYDTTLDPHEWTNEIGNPRYAQAIKSLKELVPKLSEMATPMPPVVRRPKK